MQEVVTALIVAVAVGYTVKRFAPLAWRLQCRAVVMQLMRRCGWTHLEKKLARSAAVNASCAGGCGTCNGCGPAKRRHNAESTITPDALRHTLRR